MNSHVRIAIPTPGPLRLVPRSVPLSVLCRSRRLVVLGGPTNLIMRPTPNGVDNALIGTVLTRYNRRLLNVNKMRHPNVIRQLSGSAANTVIITGASLTRDRLRTRVGTGATHHRCLNIICNTPGARSNAVSLPLNQRPGSHGGGTIIPLRGKNHRTIAR